MLPLKKYLLDNQGHRHQGKRIFHLPFDAVLASADYQYVEIAFPKSGKLPRSILEEKNLSLPA